MRIGTIQSSIAHTVDHEGKRRFHVSMHRHGEHLTATMDADGFVRMIESLHEHVESARGRGLWLFDFVWPARPLSLVTFTVESGEELVRQLEAEWFDSLWSKSETHDAQDVAV